MFEKDKCPICGNKASQAPTDKGGYIFECVRCGEFVLSGVYSVHLKNLTEIQQTNLSGYIRNNQNDYQRCIITRQLIEKKKNLNIEYTIEDKADGILLLISEKYKTPGTDILLLKNNIENEAMGKYYIWTTDEFDFIINEYLINEKQYLLENNLHTKISPAGWNHIATLNSRNQDSDTAFIAMWFHKSMEETRSSIKQAIRNAGYIPKIVDEEKHNDDITNRIITLIKRSRFVIADFTNQRAGVYYEAGFARGLNIPVIHIVKKEEIKKLHFDINHQSFIGWENQKLNDFKNELTLQITATIGDGPYINNIVPEEENIILEELLKSEDKILIKVEDNEGLTIQVNNKNLIPEQSPKTIVLWREAFHQLLDKGLIRDQGSGTVFDLTIKGHDAIDKIK